MWSDPPDKDDKEHKLKTARVEIKSRARVNDKFRLCFPELKESTEVIQLSIDHILTKMTVSFFFFISAVYFPIKSIRKIS